MPMSASASPRPAVGNIDEQNAVIRSGADKLTAVRSYRNPTDIDFAANLFGPETIKAMTSR